MDSPQKLSAAERGRFGPIEWAVASRPRPGERVCGDRALAVEVGETAALFGVLDGLGHGAEAAAAAERGVAELRGAAADPLDVLFRRCHAALATTRGAAMTLARIDFAAQTLSWLGIGNVGAELIAKHPGGQQIRSSIRLGGGIVGYRLPATLRIQQTPIVTGDLLVIASDGIGGDYLRGIDFAAKAAVIVERILGTHAQDSDDALVLAARHRGMG